jgi:Cu2+-exporting ATPase
VGEALIGGAVNVESPLVMQIEKVGADTVLSAIVRLLDRAQGEKPRLALLADRIAGWFVAALLSVAAVVFAGLVVGSAISIPRSVLPCRCWW